MIVSRNVFVLAATSIAIACGRATHDAAPADAPPEISGTAFVVRDTTIDATITANGIAEPISRATVSTRLMGTVTEVLVREGDRVRTGDLLVRIDARDLDAKRDQVLANIASADAMQREAQLMAVRMRRLFADSAAARVQLDAAEAGLSRANAALAAARAGQAELDAVAEYASVRAPFSGVITQRFVDPGAFAAPGAPLVAMQDDTRLRLVVTVAPSATRNVRRGTRVDATIEGIETHATIEGVVPTATGSLYAVNAIVENRDGALLAGGSATLEINDGKRTTMFVPATAVRRDGDLTGITLKRGNTTRWVRVGLRRGTSVELLSGVVAGDTILVPATTMAGAK